MKITSAMKKTAVLYLFLIAIISAQISCKSLKSISSLAEKISDHASEETMQIRVMSYNVLVDLKGLKWAKRGSTVADILESSNADVIGIQEATELQIATLQQRLNDYYCFVGDRSDGHRNDQKWYEYVPIFYRKDRFNLLEKSSFWISDDPTKPGGTMKGSRWHGRSITWLKLEDRKTGKVVFMFNAHTHPEKAPASVKLIQRKIHSIAAGYPIILVGDFNFKPGSEAYQLITGQSQDHQLVFQDSFTITKKQVGPVGTHGDGDERIDYIYLLGKFEVSKYEVITKRTQSGGEPSDHNPVLVELDIKLD